MTFKLLWEIAVLFAGMFVLGSLACLPVYHWNIRAFLSSRLWTKIVWWIPIFIVFCVVLSGKEFIALLVVLILSMQTRHELRRQVYDRTKYTAAYVALVIICLFHLPFFFRALPEYVAVTALISICFASVLSDVFAFFAGTYAGRHHLPEFVNPAKSYEGVAGQIIGAFAGMGLAALLPEIGFSWGLALTVGVASATGDLLNSITKRQLGIKDWGNTIPGHGGVLDRFASLSLALAAGFWFVHLYM